MRAAVLFVVLFAFAALAAQPSRAGHTVKVVLRSYAAGEDTDALSALNIDETVLVTDTGALDDTVGIDVLHASNTSVRIDIRAVLTNGCSGSGSSVTVNSSVPGFNRTRAQIVPTRLTAATIGDGIDGCSVSINSSAGTTCVHAFCIDSSSVVIVTPEDYYCRQENGLYVDAGFITLAVHNLDYVFMACFALGILLGGLLTLFLTRRRR